MWPPNPSYTSCWVRSASAASSEVNESYFLQARARKLEHWGVPLWYEIGRRMRRHYDAGSDGRPVPQCSTLALDHQWHLAALSARNPPIPVKVVRIISSHQTASRTFDPSSAPLPQDEVRRKVESTISTLVDPESPQTKTFNAFNKDMMRLLGTGVWSG